MPRADAPGRPLLELDARDARDARIRRVLGSDARTGAQEPPRAQDTPPRAAPCAFLPVLVLVVGVAVALAVWPFGVIAIWANHCQATAALVAQGKARLENIVGAAPGWLRGTLLAAAATQAAGALCGFDDCSAPRQFLHRLATRCGCAWGPAAVDGTEEQIDEIVAQLGNLPAIQPEVTRLQELNALYRMQQRSLLGLLVLGHGIKPAPRPAAGWRKIADWRTPQSTWGEARRDLGLTARQAVGMSLVKLFCWHWVQPAAYLWVCSAYYCELSDRGTVSQRDFAEVVTARELLYVSTTIAGALACPVYLLIDLETVWKEAGSRGDKAVRLACWILTPHNFVAMSLICSFRPTNEDGRFSFNRAMQLFFTGLAMAQIGADFASCFMLGLLTQQCLDGEFCAPALVISFGFTAFGFVFFFGPFTVWQAIKAARQGCLDAREETERASRIQGMQLDERTTCCRSCCRFMCSKRGPKAGGGLMVFLGLVYVVVGGILLISGEDVFCTAYTFSAVDCGEFAVCKTGSCLCKVDMQPGIGAHEACAFTVSGATNRPNFMPDGTDINGEYNKTAQICSGKPVFQQGGSGGPVLYHYQGHNLMTGDGLATWVIGPEACNHTYRYLWSSGGESGVGDCPRRGGCPGDCPESPDGAGCAGKWRGYDDGGGYGDLPSVRVVASKGR